MVTASKPTSPLEALKSGFRRACVRRLVGDEEGAVKVLRDEIPGLVVGWAKNAEMDSSEKKAKLKELFDDESGRADELAVAFDLFAGRFETRVAELVKNEVVDLVNRVDALSKVFNSAVDQFDEKIKKLNQHDSGLMPTDCLVSIPKDFSDVENSLCSNEQIGNENKELNSGDSENTSESSNIASSKEGKKDSPESVAIVPVIDGEAEIEVNDQLDPPSGTGLRFDEIEEMIDEILSYDSKKL